jgi:hypothetical protein
MTLALLALLPACASPQRGETPDTAGLEGSYRLVPTSEVRWDQLNPARGDQSPLAGTVWGDRNGRAATGFLFRPVDGFKSPPHIHNVTYRGVVISGLVHNDHPAAIERWMPARSFWTQPKGQVHITAAKGTDVMAYIEIDQGPYLVMPPEEQFQPGEQPINVHDANLVWVAPRQSNAPDGVELAFLWENRDGSGMGGNLVRLPAGESVSIYTEESEMHAVVIQGETLYAKPSREEQVSLTPGSYFASNKDAHHHLEPKGTSDTIIYVRSGGEPKVVPR